LPANLNVGAIKGKCSLCTDFPQYETNDIFTVFTVLNNFNKRYKLMQKIHYLHYIIY
jgi:hypothetical protein